MSVLQDVSVLDQVSGRILDTDSHEWIPTQYWERDFGPASAPFAAMMEMVPPSAIHQNYTAKVDDDAAIDRNTIWSLKGSSAPGAIEMDRRVAVLDAMGIDRQLIFASGPGVFGQVLVTCPLGRVIRKLLSPGLASLADSLGTTADEAVSIGRLLMQGHNDWCIRVAGLDKRLRPVAVLAPTSIDSAMAEAQRLIDAGVRAVTIPSDCPPGGKSPASADLDSFWKLFADAGVPVLLHVGGELNFKTSDAWGDVPAFESNVGDASEVPIDAYTLSTAYFGAQNFLTTMILGGVFERHPTLRIGAIELSSHWVGPMAENLTMWAEQFARRLPALQASPAEYLQRNVRVSSFWWEPVDKYIDRFGLEDVYVFSSDYPHPEGGKDTAHRFAERLGRLGPGAIEKFFVTNGELLLPE